MHPLDIAAIAVGRDSPGLVTMVGLIVFPYALFRWGSGRDAVIGLLIMNVMNVTKVSNVTNMMNEEHDEREKDCAEYERCCLVNEEGREDLPNHEMSSMQASSRHCR